VFHDALDRAADERRAFVDAQCAGDPELAAEVLALIAEDEGTGSLLDRDLAGIARDAFGADDTPPTREIGPYRLREMLGEGGMGIVYLAERMDLHNLVAIKILRDAWLSPARRQRFASEQRTLAHLNHPSIARLYEADTLPDGTPWFAMEYVDGVSLTRYRVAHRLPIRRVIELFRSVCEAVAHAHQHAVIHRDLKPSNILVTRGGQPKLLDFGIAKQLEALDTRIDRTRTELRLMTPAYAAPEQIAGEGQGVHTDVYALGAILYELLTGRPPFDLEGRSPVETAEIVMGREPERPSLIAPPPGRGERGVSWPDLDVLCLTALQKEPSRRYRSVESLIRDLDHYLAGEPLEARPDTLGYRAGKFVRRHWRPLAAALAVGLAGIGLVTFYTIRLTHARNAAVAETERTRRIQEFMTGLFQGGDPEAGPSDSLRVVELLERGARDARAFDSDPAIEAELYQTLGTIHQGLGQLERADTLLTRALAVRRTRLSPDHPDVARSLIALALLRADQSRFEEAESLATDALARSRRRERDDPGAVARATTALGTVLDDKGDYPKAIATLEDALRRDLAARLPDAEVSQTTTELANSHFYAGHYAIADSLNHRVLALDRALYGERNPHVASDLVNIGAVQQEWGRWPTAERYYREALSIYRGWYGEDHYETAATLNMVGRALVQEGRLAEAREPLERALAIRERIYGPSHPFVASTLNELALLAQKKGDYPESEANFQRMIAIYRTVYHDHHYLIGLGFSNLGTLYIESKRYADAERCFHEALRRYDTTLPAGHLYFGITRLKLGRALLRASRYADAERESQAGYAILKQQSELPEAWLAKAREDLVAEYTALGRPDDAARFRAEQADAPAGATAANSKR
jgi:eukaryotic-like serine/threonine-protein kinase